MIRAAAVALVLASTFVLVVCRPPKQIRVEAADITSVSAPLLADTPWANYPACNTPSTVVMYFTTCLSYFDYWQILREVNDYILPSLGASVIYKDDVGTSMKFSIAVLQDGYCHDFNDFVAHSGVAVERANRFPRFRYELEWFEYQLEWNYWNSYVVSMSIMTNPMHTVPVGRVGHRFSIDYVREILQCELSYSPPTTYIDAANKRQCKCCWGNQCKCGNSNQFRDVNMVCRCPANTALFYGTCSPCSSGYASPAGDKCKKICPTGFRNMNGTDHWCERDCQTGYRDNGTKCVKNCGSGFRNVNGDDHKCERKCEDGYKDNGTKCVKDCGDGFRNVEGDDHRCERNCLDGYKDNGTKCVKKCEVGFEDFEDVCMTVCPRGSYRVTSSLCCPVGEVLMNGHCVVPCYWRPNNAGFHCAWKDPAKASLKLWDDCAVRAPVPKDNYVNDKRVNKAGGEHNPLITIKTLQRGAAKPATHTTSWLDYANEPRVFENNVTLGAFGVYDLAMIATDYRGSAQCTGCIAVVDDFRPTPSIPCNRQAQIVPASYSLTERTIAMAKEQSFSSFYTDALNNGAENPATHSNVRCDIKQASMLDFFETQPSKLASLDTLCFHSDMIQVLLEKTPTTKPATYADSSLVCKRCCSKSTTLREFYYEYKCGVEPDVTRRTQLTGGSHSCSFDYCVQVAGDTLVTASVRVSDPTKQRSADVVAGLPAPSTSEERAQVQSAIDDPPIEIHEALECTSLSGSCSFTSTLGRLFTRTAEWGSEVANDATEYTARAYVYWRYSLDTNSWFDGDDSATLTFTSALTDVYVAAWTHCGRALEVQFRVVLHVHNARVVVEADEGEDEASYVTLSSMAVTLVAVSAVVAAVAVVSRRRGATHRKMVEEDAYYVLLE